MLVPLFTHETADPTGEIALAHLRMIIGELPSEQVPPIACRALERGSNSTAAVELAGTLSPSWSEIITVWNQWMRELGYPSLNPREATDLLARIEAQEVAEQVLAGKISPEDAVSSFEGINSNYGHPDFLNEYCWRSSRFAYNEPTHEERAEILKLATETLKLTQSYTKRWGPPFYLSSKKTGQ